MQLKKLETMQKFESVKEIMAGLSKSSRYKYAEVVYLFSEWLKKTPDKIIAERKAHLKSDDEKVRHTYERAVMDFYEYLKKRPKLTEASAYTMTFSTLRGFFARNYVKLEFRRGDLKPPVRVERDYIPSIGEIKEICDASDLRDRAVIITALQTGMAPVDIVNIGRVEFDLALKNDDFPRPLGWFNRQKSREQFHPFLFKDTANALKRYLANRKDGDPHLFVDRSGKPFRERNVNDIFTKAAQRAGIKVPEGKRLRVYCLRKVFETQMGNAGMPQTWIDMMMGHEVGGARGSYVKPSEADWLEKARKAEQFISISRIRNMDILREKIDLARGGDILELILAFEQALGPTVMKRVAEAYLKLRPMTVQLEEDALMSSKAVVADAFDVYMALRKGKHKRSA